MAELCSLKCKPCNAETPLLKSVDIGRFMESLSGWFFTYAMKGIAREFRFKNFKTALNFVIEVGRIAEEEGHHPDIHIYNYQNVRLELTTHAIHNLSENDFILAAKIDIVYDGMS